MIAAGSTNDHVSHAGNPSTGTHPRALPTIFATRAPIIPPPKNPTTMVMQPTPI